ncbi:M56 family metallopeptidase [Prosthecobacter vanneervenii]|uniref:Beta-lactamase regulating signal transducer with metallopeptidase domain n=1 Tax=Prosthecobacter vanneervenii TaxID=48466 RepID=A0A7W7Y799_9BACT|nr:M56 family metallopeptidase [Prosthecobacter vanneervenii]MBB5030913.1 beta-lactamase regulating signal transducer with metallopeptidase domain [Prosthecobacter vanneervenii]
MNADTLLHWLLRTSLEASVLILAVLGLRLMLGTRLSPAWRIGLWMLVGVKLMLPAFIPAGFGLGGWFQQTADASAGETVMTQRGVADEVDAAASVKVQSVAPVVSHSSASAWIPSGVSLALGLWVSGGMFVLLAAIYRQQRFHRALRRRPQAADPLLCALVASLSRKAGVKEPVRLLLMPAGTTPALVGVMRPCILLPEDWEERFDEGSLRHVLLHELLHIKNHDLIWNWTAVAVQALHWFNPLVWLVVSRFQADRELRCDAGALALLPPKERLDYGHTLLRIQETFFAPPVMAGLAPCVRNHPALRQRIHMIAQPTIRQPVLQALLTVTLGALVSYSFTTARAVEKEVPEKVRTREGSRTPAAEPPKTATNETETGAPAKAREGESGSTKATGMREGDGGTRKPGTRDGEKPRSGSGDGDGARKTGMRDGEKPRTGERDGEGARKTGARDGEKPRTTGERDGEGMRKSGARDGEKATVAGETITLRVIKGGEAVVVNGEEIAMNRLRGHLHSFLPDHAGAKVVITGEGDVPMSAMHNTMDAVRDNGNKSVSIQTE